ncbi:Prophage integrase [Escherichia coli O157:H7 str. SS52]|nr:Prophage integrase [Escherichia coli O157:H7 str. SS17]AJA26480.1 Prophage integrase [Escherichia coli O157:H7 str. SS52]
MIFNEMPRCLITVENSHEASRNIWRCNIGTVCWQTCMRRNVCVTFTNKFISSGQQIEPPRESWRLNSLRKR